MFLHRWFMLGTTKAPSILKFKNLCKFASCVHGHTDILRKCFSLTLSEIWTIFIARVGDRSTLPFLVYAVGGPLLIILHIRNWCGVRLFLPCSVGPERPTEDTKTAPHFHLYYCIIGSQMPQFFFFLA